MLNTADTKVWKDALSQLRSNSELNEMVITEVREEIRLQEERNKQEVAKMYEKVKQQTEALEQLLNTVSSDSLFPLPSDQKAKESFEQSVRDRLSLSRELLEYTKQLLDSQTTPEDKLAKLQPLSAAKKNEDQKSPQLPVFPRQALLGNWIHYFQKDMFTCQCFWDDDEFKEYDFKDGKLVEERTGTFKVDKGDVVLRFSNGKTSRYTVTGFSDDCLDYLIEDTAIRFDYMPEDLLNSLLEDTAEDVASL